MAGLMTEHELFKNDERVSLLKGSIVRKKNWLLADLK